MVEMGSSEEEENTEAGWQAGWLVGWWWEERKGGDQSAARVIGNRRKGP